MKVRSLWRTGWRVATRLGNRARVKVLEYRTRTCQQNLRIGNW